MALSAQRVMACGDATFTTSRGLEQARLDMAHSGARVIFTAQGAGQSCAVVGPAHQSCKDAAFMRAARGRHATLVIEEPSVIGGLGSAVPEALAEVPQGPVRRIGVPDLFVPIGPTHDLRVHSRPSADNIAAQVLDLKGAS